MKTTKGDLLNLWYVLDRLSSQKKNVNFSYFIAKNKIALKGEVDALNEAQEPSEVFKQYEEKRVELAQDHADRVPGTQQPMTDNKQYVITEKREEFEKKMKALKAKFKKAITEREEQIDAFSKILEEEVEFNGHSIKLENLPNEVEPVVMEVLLTVGMILEE